ncbi:MAG: DUF503 domain-containing protein [Elusimicrobia bacterium]|nr:DUF503 domain-containing protein [Elusimicrobiota bacterium]
MILASARVTLHLPEARSLKDKRQVVASVLRRLRNSHNVSAVELDEDGLWQKAVLGLAMAGRKRQEVEAALARIRRDIEGLTGLKYLDFETDCQTL